MLFASTKRSFVQAFTKAATASTTTSSMTSLPGSRNISFLSKISSIVPSTSMSAPTFTRPTKRFKAASAVEEYDEEEVDFSDINDSHIPSLNKNRDFMITEIDEETAAFSSGHNSNMSPLDDREELFDFLETPYVPHSLLLNSQNFVKKTDIPKLSKYRPCPNYEAALANSPPAKPFTFPSADQTPRVLFTEEHEEYITKVLNARVYDAAIETELQHAKNLSAKLNNTVYLKREDTQPVFSFKIRGAYNKMANLTDGELANGVVCCSAGNHAQGVALSAKMMNCKATIIMPVATPDIKVNSVRMHGGENVDVRLFGSNYDEAAAEAMRLVEEENMTMIHPFDDPYVIAGQGTIGMEILKDCVTKPLDAIFVCCGGGGMLAGIAAYVKKVRPGVKVIGVEAADAAGMTTSLKERRPVTLNSVGLFADGAAVKTIGSENFRLCNALVDDMVTVSTDQICEAIKLSYNDARVVLEPAGALGVAGMKKYIAENKIKGQSFVAITSGANMDFNRLGFVTERIDSCERAEAPERVKPVARPRLPGLYSSILPPQFSNFSFEFENKKKAAGSI